MTLKKLQNVYTKTSKISQLKNILPILLKTKNPAICSHSHNSKEQSFSGTSLSSGVYTSKQNECCRLKLLFDLLNKSTVNSGSITVFKFMTSTVLYEVSDKCQFHIENMY